MTERFDHQAGGNVVPVIPYDTFEAANLFLATGRKAEEVLALVGLDPAEWERLRETYRWFPTALGDRYRQGYFDGLDDAGICRLVLPPRWRLNEGNEPDLRAPWHIREAVRRNPYRGGHGYATDGETVWFLEEKKAIHGADAVTYTVPGPGEPHIKGRSGGSSVTDRHRPYVNGEPCDPKEWIEDWRPFFEARPDLNGWWWHRLVQPRD